MRSKPSPWPQIISGGIFLFTMAERFLALAAVRFQVGLETDFYGPASVMSGPSFINYT